MAKGTRNKKEKAVIIPLEPNEGIRNYIITASSLKDGFCNYTLEITEGIGVGTTGSFKGSGLVKEDLVKAFEKLNVHLAALDDVFKHSNIEIEDIDKYHNDELATLYSVSGIIIKGNKENESVILVGNKYVSSAGGRIEIKTPKISVDHLSSYKWYNELKEAIEVIRMETALYKEGKYTPVEVDEDAENPQQMKITDMLPKKDETDDDDDFNEHKID